nr:uncharacterized protein LOC117278096 [Nicotiana tomentosiformis]
MSSSNILMRPFPFLLINKSLNVNSKITQDSRELHFYLYSPEGLAVKLLQFQEEVENEETPSDNWHFFGCRNSSKIKRRKAMRTIDSLKASRDRLNTTLLMSKSTVSSHGVWLLRFFGHFVYE